MVADHFGIEISLFEIIDWIVTSYVFEALGRSALARRSNCMRYVGVGEPEAGHKL